MKRLILSRYREVYFKHIGWRNVCDLCHIRSEIKRNELTLKGSIYSNYHQ